MVEAPGLNPATDFIGSVLSGLLGDAEDTKREFSADALDALKRKLTKLGSL